MNDEEIHRLIATDLINEKLLAEKRWLSAAVTICWMVLGSVVIVLTRRWTWAGACLGIGIIPLYQGRWRLPHWLVMTFLLTGGLLWTYLIVMGFIAPHFNLPAPLVDR